MDADALDLLTQVNYEGEMTGGEAIRLVRTRLVDGSIKNDIVANFKPRFHNNPIRDDMLSRDPNNYTLVLATTLVRERKRKAAVEWMCADAARHIDAACSAEHEIDASVMSAEESARIKRRAYDEWTAAEQALESIGKLNCSNDIGGPDPLVASVMQELDDARQGGRRKALDELAEAIGGVAGDIAEAIERAAP